MSLLDWNCPSQDDARPVVADDNIFASLSRKRKISKIWENVLNIPLDQSYLGAQMCALGRPPDDNNRQPHKEQRKGAIVFLRFCLFWDSTTKMANWRVADIDAGLAADFDDSLSGLGVEIGTETYNMSEALLALPSLPVFKQEVTENGLTALASPRLAVSIPMMLHDSNFVSQTGKE
uniref:Uncharacterized protein n=1 Tax=Strigamia maritima TaxID=126957 RepID=T1JI62_STRMM